MTLKYTVGLLLVAAMLTLACCSKLKEQPVVDYVMKDFKAESTPGCTADSTCALFTVQYPEFLSLDTTIRKAIADQISIALYSDGPKSLDELGADFIKEFNDFMKDVPAYDLGWWFSGHVKVLISSDTLISLQVETGSFTGSAHENYNTNFVNVEPKTGTSFLLDAILRPGYQEDLNRLGEEEFHNQLESGERDSLAVSNLLDADFKLPDNYGFRKEGIVFYLNSYDLGSFTDGPFEILIPYEKLQDWMK